MLLHVLLLLYLLLHAAVTLHFFPLHSFVAADRDWACRVALPVANATTAPKAALELVMRLAAQLRRGSRCCELIDATSACCGAIKLVAVGHGLLCLPIRWRFAEKP